jgi:DNA-binding SARP family transcriptional activator
MANTGTKGVSYTVRREPLGPAPAGSAALTKITRPKTTGVILRERLFGSLDAYRRSPVIWVAAPAGSGKTTLVASYLAARKLRSIWYRIDDRDGDIASFFFYMALAAEKAAPAGHGPLPLFTPEYRQGLNAFTLHYFEKLYNCLRPPFAVVLDNYHLVQAQTDFHDVMCGGLGLLPEGINAVIISRKVPPPRFARLQANETVTLMQRDAIRFTEDESEALIGIKGRQGLTASGLSRFHERTRGWAAGLVLMARSQGVAHIAESDTQSQTPQEIFDYFATEIFEKLDREEQAFLLKTSFLPWVSVGIAEKLTASGLPKKILTRLYRDHFFTERDAGAQPVYRYHPLFREFLLSRARGALTPEEISTILRTAAALFLEGGHSDEAASFFIKAGDWEGVVSFLLDRAQAFFAQGRIHTLGRWLRAIPRDIIGKHPWLLYWIGQCTFWVTPALGLAYYEEAFYLFEKSGDDIGALLTWKDIVLTFIFAFEDLKPLDRWIDWLSDRIQRNLPFPTPEVEADVSSTMLSALLWRRPHQIAGGRWMERALAIPRSSCLSTARLMALIRSLNYFNWMGDQGACRGILNEIERIAASRQTSAEELITVKMMTAHYHAWLGDDSDRAFELVEEGLSMAEDTGIHALDAFLASMGAEAAWNAYDMEAAERYTEKLKRSLRPGDSYVAFYYEFGSGLAIVRGKYSEALSLAEQAWDISRQAGHPFSEAWAGFMISQAAFELGDAPRAESELAACEKFFRAVGSLYFEFMALLARAYFLFRRGLCDAGREVLERALTMGRQNGYTNSPLLCRPDFWSLLCAKGLEAGIEPQYTRAFIHRRRVLPPAPAALYESWPWPLKIYTLGRFEVHIDGNRLEFQGKSPRKVIALLKLLVACGVGGAEGEKLADLLWPDSDGDGAQRAFAISLHRLRQLLGSDQTLQLRDGLLKIDPRQCWVDAHAFETLLAHAQAAAPADEAPLAEAALHLYQGPFLGGYDASWALSYRERLQSRFLRAILRLGNHFEGLGHLERAVDLYRQGLEMDGLAEELYRRLMKCHRTAGQAATAIATYRRCRRMLRSALGVDPSPETQAVYRTLRNK